MAGGGGTRLWPLSRPDRPKQILPILGGKSLFEYSVERLLAILPADSVFVVTGNDLAVPLRKLAPRLPFENFLVEPSPRNTAPAIAFALASLKQRAPQFTMACLPSDHFIANQAEFHRVIRVAETMAARGYLVTLGIEPLDPNTGYGYIEQGERLDVVDQLPVYQVRRFKEKPGLEEAGKLIAHGGHSWNSGMFVWRSDVMEAEFRRQQPMMAEGMDQVAAEMATRGKEKNLAACWDAMPVLSVDYAIMENAAKVAVVPVKNLGWTDIGNWDALIALYERHPELQITTGGEQYDAGSHSIKVFREGVSHRVLATVGLDNVIIVETEEAILVCKRGKSQDVRSIVEAIQKNHSALS